MICVLYVFPPAETRIFCKSSKYKKKEMREKVSVFKIDCLDMSQNYIVTTSKMPPSHPQVTQKSPTSHPQDLYSCTRQSHPLYKPTSMPYETKTNPPREDTMSHKWSNLWHRNKTETKPTPPHQQQAFLGTYCPHASSSSQTNQI